MNQFYKLPELPYANDALEPILSEEQLTIHHDKHHLAYVDNANKLLEKLDNARKNSEEIDFGATYKTLSFNVGGHILHSLFWENMTPNNEGGAIDEKLKKALEDEYGSIDRFKLEFANTAEKVEGSGWAALTYCKKTKRLLIMQIQNHNLNIYPMFSILLVLDVWEHAYYLDYQNKRKNWIEEFWNIVNWQEVEARYEEAIK